MTTLRCPRCHEPADGLMAEQTLTGTQVHRVWTDHHGTLCLEPVDYVVTHAAATLELVCPECNHRWRTGRDFRIGDRP